MNRTLYLSVVLACVLSACNPAEPPTPVQATAAAEPTATTAPTAIPSPTAQPGPLPLSELGPYGVGWRRMIEYQDAARKDRKVTLTVWYPAQTAESTLESAVADAAPDPKGAPYPVVLSSTKMGFIFAPHLASYGFVVVGINGQDSAKHWGPWLSDYPLDLVFALNQIAATPIEGLEGMIDTDNAGAMGYSFDAFTSLALSGARVDPQYYQEQCSKAAAMSPAPPAWWIEYICDMEGGWEAFVANAGPAIASGDDGLWQPMTDPRIKAVIPMAPEGAWLFGERGLAAADRAILIIAAGSDTINIYDLEAAYIFDHLGTPDRTMISFLGQDHMMVDDPLQVTRMRHFAAAFFGLQLQQNKDFAKYLSEEFIGQYEDLSWVARTNP